MRVHSPQSGQTGHQGDGSVIKWLSWGYWKISGKPLTYKLG